MVEDLSDVEFFVGILQLTIFFVILLENAFFFSKKIRIFESAIFVNNLLIDYLKMQAFLQQFVKNFKM